MVNLTVDLGGLRLKNPVLTASGTFGYGHEYADFMDLSALGGIIVKGTTAEPRQGNPYPRMAETPSGMLNAVGLQNKGVEHFATEIYPTLHGLGTEVIVNVSGSSVAAYCAAAERLADLGKIHAIELNISCPNVRQGGMAFGTDCTAAAEVVGAVRRVWPRHLMVKLSPNVTDIVAIARAAEDAGADSLSLINTLLGMAVDVERRRPALSTVTGGLSGPAVRPVAVRMVWQVAKAVKVPVVGLGGICSVRDALEFIMAGAMAVQIGTANFVNPRIAADIASGLADYCRRESLTSLDEIRGVV
ncbi:MAG: dihydroorotate dehydrogenase [Muribaculaceae bacterium]|nr:dihydroorotate dehydrogenase [Muribaculaceae bacterium]